MRTLIFVTALGAVGLPVWAADAIGSATPDINPQEIIQKFAAKEAEFAQARNNYTYRQSVKLEEIDPPGGKWELVEDIIFSPEGKRMEKVIYAPVMNLQHILLTPQDQQDLRDVQPFVLTTEGIPDYDIHYLGREKVDEIGTYAFSVKPKKLAPNRRYFEGQIWVDDRDLQIVKTYGKGVGVRKGDDAYPKFETYREQIDGKYWFPTYTHADDTLHFKSGENVHVRMVVKYQDYKHYEGRSTIRFGEVVDDKKPAESPKTDAPKK
ncbi:MAG: hypothetical protein JO323_03935 [Acidobacteriia bacterium]|nr:hypothetical protein [Terriglobia bacterium]